MMKVMTALRPLLILRMAQVDGSDVDDDDVDDINSDDSQGTPNNQVNQQKNKSTKKSTSSSTTATTRNSLLEKIDKVGLSLKPRAVAANSKMVLAETKRRKFRYLAQTCFYYTLFLLYRGYRGCFVILPAVFREVYYKLERAVDLPSDDDKDNSIVDSFETTEKVPWRTRITVSILASIVTTSYALGGAFRVMIRFAKNLLQTSNLSDSFEAAVLTQEENEDKILRLVKKPPNKQQGEEENRPPSNNNNNNNKSNQSTSQDLAP